MTLIDAHLHLWRLNPPLYPWLTRDLGILYRDYMPEELAPHLREAGVNQGVLVQAANHPQDTETMLEQAGRHDWIGAVIGWVPLAQPSAAGAALEAYAHDPHWRGVRHLIHLERDPDWIVRPNVLAGVALLEQAGLVLELPATYPLHLCHVPQLASRFAGLTIVINHLGAPPIADGVIQPWARDLARCAEWPNVYAKVSGLGTAARSPSWSAADIRPYIELALASFTPHRLMFGSDWPVCLLAGNYAQVHRETRAALAMCSESEAEAILGGTAARVYDISAA